ncbi:MAG TPA: type I-U CRISPR-associated protein Csx17 [Vicinamibacterales bacterium]|nr:type I-U CRISPR-associated protein Csx17 [Vicinamibacterales bacterium]
MAGHVLELHGCTPEPLGNYLKGLGVFRLIAEQADPQARAWWESGVLFVLTKWAQEEVISFFLHGIGDEKEPIYCPTPIFAPWGGRPGFYADGNAKAKEKLDALRDLKIPGRFTAAQRLVKVTDDVLKDRGWADVTKKKRSELKVAIVAAMRNAWSDSALAWFDACLSLEEDARFGFLFGTGGNEGSADITNNFWDLIEETIGLPTPTADSRELLIASIFGGSRVGGTSKTAGQHFPLAAGSSNCGQAFEGAASGNPWDFILMMEGAVLFAGATTKRLSQHGKGKSAFPFMIDYVATEEPSTSLKEEAKQDARVARCRAEFWMPLWRASGSLWEIRALLAEGRLQRRSGEQTEHTLHAMEAIKTLGVSRGIDTFQRIGLFERRGKGYYLASSLGFHCTSSSASSVAAQLAEIEDFRQGVYRYLREGPGIPDRILRARQRFHAALGLLLERDEHREADALLEVMLGAGAIERELRLLKDRARLLTPCPALASTWLGNENESSEYRLARAIAGITTWGEVKTDGRRGPAVECLRANLLPVARPWKVWEWYDAKRHKGFRDTSVWSRGAPLDGNLAAVLHRRLIDAQRGDGDGLPLWSPYGASFEDLLAVWHGEVDEPRMADLIHGLSLVDPGSWNTTAIDKRQKRHEPTPDLQTGVVWFDDNDEARTSQTPLDWHGEQLLSRGDLRAAFQLPRVYHLLKLCFVGGRLPRRPGDRWTVERSGGEPFPAKCLDVLTLVMAGRLAEAAQLAGRRLRAKGYPAVLRDSDLAAIEMEVDQCRRLAGMLLIPVRQPGVCAALTIKPASTT